MNLKEVYQKEVLPKLMTESGKVNVLACPKIVKVIVSCGIGKFKDDPKLIESAAQDLKTISGQSPKITRSRAAISAFKLKENDVVGLVVTLRNERMWSFLEKLVAVVLPRMRDFRGVDRSALDGHGNLSLGFPDHTIFPEIDANRVDKIKSLGVTVVTSAGDDEAGYLLLASLGFPFKKE